MSIEDVKTYLKAWGKDTSVMEFDVSCATVEQAAKATGVEEARMAKEPLHHFQRIQQDHGQ